LLNANLFTTFAGVMITKIWLKTSTSSLEISLRAYQRHPDLNKPQNDRGVLVSRYPHSFIGIQPGYENVL